VFKTSASVIGHAMPAHVIIVVPQLIFLSSQCAQAANKKWYACREA
jgi:hypothetical protein